MVCLSVCLSVAASEARAQEYYAADYYDDGESLWLIDGWEEPYLAPDPEADFQTVVNMPLYSGGGGGGGSGLVEGTDPNTKNNSASDAASASTINSFARPCRNRVCPTVMSTGRYRGVTGVVRVFLIQDIGDNFSVFARLAREEPPETSFTIEEHNNQRITCTDETETRKAALADAVLGPASAGVLRRGQSVTAVFVDGTDTWVIQKSGSGTTLANVLGGSAVPNSATGRCAGAGG